MPASARGGRFEDMRSEDWHRVLRVNLDGAFFTLRGAARQMLKQGDGGVLIGTASVAAIEGRRATSTMPPPRVA